MFLTDESSSRFKFRFMKRIRAMKSKKIFWIIGGTGSSPSPRLKTFSVSTVPAVASEIINIEPK